MCELPALVSIVIPCFRQGPLLAEAIDSALAQSYPHVQVVVVNDGSDDDTDAVAQRYGTRIRYVAKTNGGLASARNAGIEVADGSYLLFLDADDLLHPDAIAWLMAATEGHERCLAVMGYRKFANLAELDTVPEGLPSDLSLTLPRMIQENFGPPNAYLCSRAMLKEVGLFASDVPGCEDWDLWLRLLLAGARPVAVRHAGALYRLAPGSMSTNVPRMLQGRVGVLVRACSAVLREPELLARLGDDLVEAAERVYRRCMIHQASAADLNRLEQCLAALQRAGFRTRQSWTKNAARAFFGRRVVERLAVQYLRVRDPAYYDYCARFFY